VAQLEIQFDFDQAALEALAAGALDRIAALAPRAMSAMERRLLTQIFWARASASDTWIDIKLDGVRPHLCLEPTFERGFIARALRMLGRPPVELVRWV
jgi:hypothetical protein